MSEIAPLTYQDSGVDIAAGNELVDRIKSTCAATSRPEVIGSLGGFGGAFSLPTGYKEPVLISGTDGVGTKLKLAIDTNEYSGVGIDLVAMCVNDIIVAGAEPLYFLDYYATGQLDLDVAETVIKGIAEGCIQAGCALIGGETAEMPGMYQKGDFDLAGFTTGIVEKSSVIDGSKIKAGDAIIGLGSSGPHSNGFSLIRKVLEVTGSDLNQPMAGTTLAKALMAPTKIYVKSLLALIAKQQVNGLAHITGGGLLENIPRVLPKELAATIDYASWETPELFQWLQAAGNISPTEMNKTFNCGVGMVVIVPQEEAESAIALLQSMGETAFKIGAVTPRENAPVILENLR